MNRSRQNTTLKTSYNVLNVRSIPYTAYNIQYTIYNMYLGDHLFRLLVATAPARRQQDAQVSQPHRVQRELRRAAASIVLAQ